MPATSAVDFRVGSVRPSAIYRGSLLVWSSSSGGVYPASMPTLPEPAPGSTLASGGNLATAVAAMSANETLYLDGTYTLSGATFTLPNTKPGIKLVRKPGAPMPTITGDTQIRLYGDNQQLRGLKIVQNGVDGKNIEVSGSDQAIIECDMTNNFASGSTLDAAMIQTSPDGPSGICTGFLAYGNFMHQIGNPGSTFQHGFYLRDLNGGVLHSNRFYQIHGGYSFHCYPNTKNVEMAYNKHASGLFTTLWESVANDEVNNYYHHNVWSNSYTGMAHAPVESNVASGNNNRYQRNAGWNTNTAQGGNTGISASAGLVVSNNATLDPQFVSPSTGDFTIGNQAVIDHIAV